MPLITTRASVAYGAGFGAITTVPVELVGSFDALASVTAPSGGLSDVIFNNIPSGYRHLQLRTTSFFQGVHRLQFNGDTTSNYNAHGLRGNGSTISAYSTAAGATNSWIQLATNNPTSNTFPQVYIIDIFDYASTSKTTTVRVLTGFDSNGTAERHIEFISGLWLNTAAVTSIRFNPSTTILARSRFDLYGVRA